MNVAFVALDCSGSKSSDFILVSSGIQSFDSLLSSRARTGRLKRGNNGKFKRC